MQSKELDVLLKQYEAVRNEINLQTRLQNNTINYSIAIIAGAFVILTIKDPQNQLIILNYPIVLLFISIFLCFVTWSVLEAEMAIHDLTNFIHKKLSDQIRQALNLPVEKKGYFKMEFPILSKQRKVRNVIRGMMASSKFFISFFPSIICFSLYFRMQDNLHRINLVNWIFICLSFILLLSIPIILIYQARFVIKYYWKD